jgi:hypothetical protein
VRRFQKTVIAAASNGEAGSDLISATGRLDKDPKHFIWAAGAAKSSPTSSADGKH